MRKRTGAKTAAAVAAASLCVGVVGAQTPPLGDAKHVVLEVLIVAPGKEVPRVAAPKSGELPCTAFAFEGRKLAWRVGDKQAATTDELKRTLYAVCDDRDTWRVDPDDARERVPLPLRVQAGAEARYADVTEAVDAALAAGFREIHLIGAAAFEPQFVMSTGARPVLDGGATVLPRAIFQEPDDGHLKWRPVLRVDQAGCVSFEGATVFDPRMPDDVKALRAALERCARTDLDGFGTRRFGARRLELSNNYVLLHSDKWTPWSTLRAVARLATEVRPALYQLRFAVAEQDVEARVCAGERFPEPPARAPATGGGKR
jgi:hypothetical protein